MLHDFSYHRPETLEEALNFLAQHGPDTAVFSGGTDLFVVIRAGLVKPVHVLDLKGIAELRELKWSASEGLSIGACVTINELLEYPHVKKEFPILHTAGEELATFQLRNRATVIGNIVTASPCGDMSGPLYILGGDVVLQSASGERTLPMGKFITGVKQTIIQPDEIVTRIIVPPTWARAPGGYEKLKRIKGHDLGVVSVSMIKHKKAIRCAIGSAAPKPVLLPDFPADAAVEDIKSKAQEMISPIDDVRATAEYRTFMVGEFITRLMERI
ncbi:MAG: xanthine dehydrogenase family protein subunit M [Alkalispirochaeta sp.]|jgi:carbon-monoxide dehydrogenase medium subunit